MVRMIVLLVTEGDSLVLKLVAALAVDMLRRRFRPLMNIVDGECYACGDANQRADDLAGLPLLKLPLPFLSVLGTVIEDVFSIHQRLCGLPKDAVEFIRASIVVCLGGETFEEHGAFGFPASLDYPSFRSMTIPKSVPNATSSRNATIPSRVIHRRAESISSWSCASVLRTISRRALSVEPSID